MNAEAGARRGLFYGWYITGVCMVIATLAWGFGFYGLGVYVRALSAREAWSPTVVSSCVGIYFLLGAIISTYVGGVIDRRGPRLVLTVGTLAFTVGIAGLALVRELWQLAVPFLLMSVGWGCLTVTALGATLVRWFKRRLGLASGIAFSGASLAGIVVAPLLVVATESYGFTTAVLGSSAIFCLVALPLVLLLVKSRPADVGQYPDGDPPMGATEDVDGRAAATVGGELPNAPAWTRARALRSPQFWTIAGPFSLAMIAQVGFLVHQLSIVTTRVPAKQAAAVVSVTSLAGFLGRIAISALADRLHPRALSVMVLLGQAAGLVGVALGESEATIYASCVLFGLGIGNVITLPSLIVRRDFGPASFGALSGAVNGITHCALGLGPLLVGAAHAHFGGYAHGLFLLVTMNVLAALAMLFSLRAVDAPTERPRSVAWKGWAMAALVVGFAGVGARMTLAGSPPRAATRQEASVASEDPGADWVVGRGQVESADGELRTGAAVAGRIARTLVRQGDQVVPGQALIEFEQGVALQSVRAAKAELARAEAELERVRRGPSKEERATIAAEAALAENRAAASRDAAARLRARMATGKASADALARAEQRAEADALARAAADAWRQQSAAGTRKEDRHAARAKREAAEAKLAAAYEHLDRTVVRAPTAGEILEVDAKPGEYRVPETTRPLVTLGDTHALRARIRVDAREIAQLTVGNAAYLVAGGHGDHRFEGQVAAIGRRASPRRANEDRHDPVAGQEVEVLIDIDHKRTLVPGVPVAGYVKRTPTEQRAAAHTR